MYGTEKITWITCLAHMVSFPAGWEAEHASGPLALGNGPCALVQFVAERPAGPMFSYSVTLPVDNDLPCLTVVHITLEAPDRDMALDLAITEAKARGYGMDFKNRVATVELD